MAASLISAKRGISDVVCFWMVLGKHKSPLGFHELPWIIITTRVRVEREVLFTLLRKCFSNKSRKFHIDL